jgi:Flp pilus assembly protein TadB
VATMRTMVSSDGGSSGGGWRWMTKYRACHASSENTLLQGISGHSRPSMLRCKTRQTMIISKASAGSRRSRFSSCSASIRQPLFNEEKKKKDTKKKKKKKEKKKKEEQKKKDTNRRKRKQKKKDTHFICWQQIIGLRDALVLPMPPVPSSWAIARLMLVAIAINAIKVGVLFYFFSFFIFFYFIKVGVLFYFFFYFFLFYFFGVLFYFFG